jgi:uncharacterized protein (DUF1778 family)
MATSSYTNTSIFLLADDLDVIKRAARKAGVKQSALIREAAMRAARRILAKESKTRKAA